MNTTHAYTNSQALHDQPEKDLRGLAPPHCRLCLTPAAQRRLWVKLFLSWMGV
jgi:hypothetical protein